MAVKDALLALLADGPQYGYQLKSAFETATGHNWPLNIGQIYSTLQRLDRDSLIVEAGEPGDDGRRSYELTAAGREALTHWFAAPADPPGTDRNELSMKVLIAVATNPASALLVVNDERTAAMGHLQTLTAHKARATSADLATRLHLDRTVLLADAQVRWLNLVEQRVEQVLSTAPTSHSPNAASSKETRS